ncbi:hypothetical protein AHAS_Ahas18G0247000 [Arachis hypogaea]
MEAEMVARQWHRNDNSASTMMATVHAEGLCAIAGFRFGLMFFVITGYRRSKIDLLKKTNPTSDKNYKARIIVKRDKKLEYMLTSVNTQHNHDVSLSMAKSLKKNRKLSLHVKWIAEINDESSVTMRNTYQSFSNCEWYDMPFVSFVGVNHHGQPVLLGCALLSCEEESSFVWLFDSWIRCTGGKPPISILMDQWKAM